MKQLSTARLIDQDTLEVQAQDLTKEIWSRKKN